MIGSCLAEIMCMFSDPYSGYIDNLCIHSNSVAELLEISGSMIPQEYVSGACDSDLYDVQDWLIKETQEKFFVRKGERHHTKVPAWIVENQDKILEIIHTSLPDLLSSKMPSNEFMNPDCTAILGATKDESEKRISAMFSFVQNGFKPGKVFLLTGQRELLERELSNEEDLLIRDTEGYSPNKILMETDMMRLVYKKYTDIDPIAVDTMPCNMTVSEEKPCVRARPNTEDTVEAFLEQQDYCNSVSFVSRAPNILAQYESTAKVMKNNAPKVGFEFIGGSANIYELPANMKPHAVHHILMPLAGSFFGAYERVSAKISEFYGQCPVDDYMLRFSRARVAYRDKH